MKKHIILGTSFLLLLASCAETNSNESSNKPAEEHYDWTITFECNGGEEVTPIKVKDGEIATKPTNPSKEGYIFQEWFVDTYLTTSFDWGTEITSNWTLYAGWKVDEAYQSSEEIVSSSEEEISSSEETINKGHGPEGSTLVSWYLVGSGSLWGDDGWTIAGGVQLYSNPASDTDKGCILGLSFKAGDTFKVTDGGSTWFGYEKVDSSVSDKNLGLTNFEGASDGFGGNNFKCTVDGEYDMYVNGKGVFWIQAAA